MSLQALADSYPKHISTVIERHELALDKAGADWVAILAGSQHLAFLDDRHYPFIANPHFRAWVPLVEHPESCIVYRRGQRPRLIYVQPRDFWYKPPNPPSGYWVDQFDVTIVSAASEVAGALPTERGKGIAIGELDPTSDFHGIDRINPASAINLLHNARTVKTDYEVACLREAQRMAVNGHRAAERAFRDGASEYDIHMAYCAAMDQREQELPYNNIVALNENTAVLHYQYLERKAPASPLSFLIDAGAEFNGYAADITRTYSLADARFQALIDSMDELQRSVVASVKSGVDFRELHLETHRRIAGVLLDNGIASGATAEALFELGVTRAFYPHGLGHYLGLQVHDVGGLTSGDNATPIDRPEGHESLRLTRSLQSGQVLTIEPGLYIIDMLLEPLRGEAAGRHLDWKTIDALRPFGGIRIEDNVRVTDDGCENLTRDAFAHAA